MAELILRLKEEHIEIMRAFGIVHDGIRNGSLGDGPLMEELRGLKDILVAHLDLEDKMLYPALNEAGGEAEELVGKFSEEMFEISKVAMDFFEKYMNESVSDLEKSSEFRGELDKIIMPDQEDVKLEINIENVGGGDATFVKAKLILPNGVSASSSFSDNVNLETIETKGNKVAVFFIDTDNDLDSGNLEGELELEYKSDNDKKFSSLDFDLPVKGIPQFNILGSSVSPSVIFAGEGGKLSINIQNIGEEKGEETSVRVFENADHPFDFDEKTNFVGSLEKGESGTAVFNFDVDDDANVIEYVVKVQIRTLSRGNVIVSEYSVPIRISEGEESGGYLYVGSGFIVLLVVLIFVVVKKKRQFNSLEGEEF